MEPLKDYIRKYGQPGDIIGCSGRHYQSDFINLMTYGIPRLDLSHVGILCDYKGELLIFQSTTLCSMPCHIQGKAVSGTQAQEIGDFVASEHARIYHYPLSRFLYTHEKVRLRSGLLEDIGKPYDMVGAFHAGGYLFGEVCALLTHQCRATIFCSEWCAEQHSAIGVFPTGNYSRWNPNSLVRAERHLGVLCPAIRVA